MATIHYDADIDRSTIENKRVAVLGYGSQGHAHALNLRDSGVEVVIGLRPDSPSRPKAEGRGFDVLNPDEAAKWADVVAMLVPDTRIADLYTSSVEPAMREGRTLLLAHGFALHYGTIAPVPGMDVVLVAPKGPGHLLRRTYLEGSGIPALIAVGADESGKAHDLALAYAAAVGCGRAGIIETTFAEETETDLFGEQAVLCGGMAALVTAGFQTLVEAGYQPESAYFECVHELKFIVDLMVEHGLEGMRFSISETAEYGDYTRGPKIIGEAVRAAMREVLTDIRNGSFARELIAEMANGGPRLAMHRAEQSGAPLDRTGRHLRRSVSSAASAALQTVSGG